MIKILLGVIFVFSNSLFAQETATQSKPKLKSEQVPNEVEKRIDAKQAANVSKELKRLEKAERKMAKKEEKKLKSEAKAEEKRLRKAMLESDKEAKSENEVVKIDEKTNKNTEVTLSKIEVTQTQEVFSKQKKEVAPKILKSLKTTPIKKSLAPNKVSDKASKSNTKSANPLVLQKNTTETKSIKATVKKRDIDKGNAVNAKTTTTADKVTGQYKDQKVYTGPYGGRYYLNPKGIKIYIQK